MFQGGDRVSKTRCGRFDSFCVCQLFTPPNRAKPSSLGAALTFWRWQMSIEQELGQYVGFLLVALWGVALCLCFACMKWLDIARKAKRIANRAAMRPRVVIRTVDRAYALGLANGAGASQAAMLGAASTQFIGGSPLGGLRGCVGINFAGENRF